MLTETIEKNEQFLRVCGKVAKFTGLLLLVFIAIQIGGAIYLFFENVRHLSANNSLYTHGYKWAFTAGYKWAFTALLLLGINQLIKCLIETDFRPNWILRYSDKIIYLYAFCLSISFTYNMIMQWSNESTAHLWLSMTFGTVSILIRIVLWISFGQVMRRIFPMIKESRTLV